MWLQMLLGRFFARVFANFRSAIVKARADDPRIADEVARLVREAEDKYGPERGEEKRRYVIDGARKYARTLGVEVLTVGVDALIVSAMEEIGLIVARAA